LSEDQGAREDSSVRNLRVDRRQRRLRTRRPRDRDRLLPTKPPPAPRAALVRVAAPVGQQELERPAVQTAGKPWIVK
jgi:hypothetical protein